jgi:hypothetical protein
MGLAIYLYRYTGPEEWIVHKEGREGGFLSPPGEDDDWDAFHERLDSVSEGIEQNSVKYPDCYSKVGYFRSSYNNSGTNSTLRALGLHDLYSLFAAENGDYLFPDWQASYRRVVETLELLKLAEREGIPAMLTFMGEDPKIVRLQWSGDPVSSFALQETRMKVEIVLETVNLVLDAEAPDAMFYLYFSG